MVDLFARFRQIGEGRMRLRVGQRLSGRAAGGNRADKALPNLQLRQMDGGRVQTFGGIEFEHAIGAQHIERAHFRDHVLRDLANNPVKALLRLKRLRHEFAEPLQQDTGTRCEVCSSRCTLGLSP